MNYVVLDKSLLHECNNGYKNLFEAIEITTKFVLSMFAFFRIGNAFSFQNFFNSDSRMILSSAFSDH